MVPERIQKHRLKRRSMGIAVKRVTESSREYRRRVAGKTGHALSPFRHAKWKSKCYNGVATSPKSPVSLLPHSLLLCFTFLPYRTQNIHPSCSIKISKNEIVVRIWLIKVQGPCCLIILIIILIIIMILYLQKKSSV